MEIIDKLIILIADALEANKSLNDIRHDLLSSGISEDDIYLYITAGQILLKDRLKNFNFKKI